MPPPVIPVEDHFTKFIRTFRDGLPLSEYVDNIPTGALNADYYFPIDNIVVELKTLEVDALDLKSIERRIMASYKWLGYQITDYVDFLFGRSYLPDDVSRRVFNTISRPIIDCIRKANKQLVSSRRIIGKPDAKGLILVANSGNFGFQPMQIMNVVLKGFEQTKDKSKDAIVYFTPNVYHEVGDDGVPYELWVPIANEQGEELQQFIDDIGGSWFDFRENSGQEFVSRKADDDFSPILNAQVIRDWDD